jgi:hypothetical protein
VSSSGIAPGDAARRPSFTLPRTSSVREPKRESAGAGRDAEEVEEVEDDVDAVSSADGRSLGAAATTASASTSFLARASASRRIRRCPRSATRR